MTAFIILMEEDILAMMRSWTVWMWLAISGTPGTPGYALNFAKVSFNQG